MHSIELSIDILAPLPVVRGALSSREGLCAWFAEDTELDGAGRYKFSFGERVVTFKLTHSDDRGIRMTCVNERNNPDWLGTELAITLMPTDDGKTRVALVHAGYPSKNECYTRCIEGWQYFLASLALYVTTGKGTPFEAHVAAAMSAPTYSEVAS